MRLEKLSACTCSFCSIFLKRFHEPWVCHRQKNCPPSFLVKRERAKRADALEIGWVQKITIPTDCFQSCKSGAGFYKYTSKILHRKDLTALQKRKIISDSALVLMLTHRLPAPICFWLRICWRGGIRWQKFLEVDGHSGLITGLRLCEPSVASHLLTCATDVIYLDQKKKTRVYFFTSSWPSKKAHYMKIPCWRIADSLIDTD